MQGHVDTTVPNLQEFEQKALNIYHQRKAAELQKLVMSTVEHIHRNGIPGFSYDSLDPKKIQRLLVSSAEVKVEYINPE